MKEVVDNVKLLEGVLGRDLTEDEKKIVINKGMIAFLESIELSGMNLMIYSELRHMLMTLFTLPDEEFENEVEEMSEESVCALEQILDMIYKIRGYDDEELEFELDDEDDEDDEDGDDEDDNLAIEDYITLLKAGETLKLDPDLIEIIVDRLWNEEKDVRIEVKNDKICLK